MEFNTIEFSTDAAVARIALNRPAKYNCFNDEMHRELRAALERVDQSAEIRCLLLTGNGKAFGAGQDLADRQPLADGSMPDLGLSVETNYNPLIRAITSLRIPVIAAVNGIAAGASASLALACDIVIAARSASFMLAFCKIGVIPDSGCTWHLPRAIGSARARGMALLGEKISAEKAEQWGLIWECVDDADLVERSTSLAHHLATQPTRGLSLIKQALNASPANSLDAQLELEKNLMRLAGRTGDYREGVMAFLEKRTPRFTGS